MDRKEKNERKAKLSQYLNLSNGRFTDYEIGKLESLVENRNKLDGTTKTYRSSYKTFDSEDTYRVEEKDTYTFHCDSDNDKIYIDRDFEKHWDDGQDDITHEKYDTARDILKLLVKIFTKFDE